MFFPIKRPLITALPAFLAIGLFVLNLSGIINFHELDALDLRFRLRGARAADSRILLVTIDDSSLQALGQWPWPRSLYAVFLDKISIYQPARVFFDILFSETGADPEADKRFAESIKKAGNVILAFYFDDERLKPTFPLPEMSQAAQSLGFVNVIVDGDGRVRRFRPSVKFPEGEFFHPAVIMSSPQKGDRLELPFKPVPFLHLNFSGPLSSFRTISFGEVIRLAGLGDESQLRELFKNKLILVGHTATATTDVRPTPFMTQSPGILVLASAVDTLLKKSFLREWPPWEQCLLLIFLTQLIFWTGIRFGPQAGLINFLAVALGYAFLNLVLFIFRGLILPFVLPQVGMLLSYGLALFIRFLEIRFQSERTAQELKSAAEIQKSFLPVVLPQIGAWGVSAACHFAREVGGDFYDGWDLGQGRLGFCLGDVAGKGMPAALYMAKTLSELRAIPKQGKMPGEVLAELNERLAETNTTGMFVTLFYGLIDSNENKLFFSSGGHEPALLYDFTKKSLDFLNQAKGVPLGSFVGMEYPTASLNFEEGNILLVYSDGAREMRNEAGMEFGPKGLERVLVSSEKLKDREEIVRSVMEKIEQHRQSAPIHDDCTLLVVRKSESASFSSPTCAVTSRGES
ncbi:MAG: CHASE2 domain-containing protein [Candidatus Omnitrophica bacterium]|nr:CHASE2 domain-containing protein [Candidatus Omnitrophota bacterium]